MKNRINELRLKKGMSMFQLAQKVDISIKMMQYIESGEYYPPMNLAERICIALGTDKFDDVFIINKA